MKFGQKHFRQKVVTLCAVIWGCAPLSAFAQSSFFDPENPPTADQATGEAIGAVEFGPDQVCLSLSRCLEILDGHAPDSFDYTLLAADFDRFGAEAQTAVLERVFTPINSEAAAQDANRALHILARQRGLLSPEAQRRIVALWSGLPGNSPLNIDDLSTVLTRHISPMVRAAAIDGLRSSRMDVRRASQIMLTRLAASDVRFALSPADIQKLARALTTDPHPGVVAVLAQDSGTSIHPILAKTLKSGDAASVKMAYQALYDRDREEAFRALVSTLYGLEDNDIGAALALAAMLRSRHGLRDDGFYMTFARDLADDPKMSVMGRAAGFDALLQTGAALADTPLNRASYARALDGFAARRAVPKAYYDLLLNRDPKTVDVWLSPLSKAVSRSRQSDRLRLIDYAGRFDSPLALSLSEGALQDENNHAVFTAGLLARVAQSNASDKAALLSLSGALKKEHPIAAVRQAAHVAEQALAAKNTRTALARAKMPPLGVVNKSELFCKVPAQNFSVAAKQMPYFQAGQLASGAPALRGWLRTASRIRGGWLAGYASPKSGALLLYDTGSETATTIMPPDVPDAHHAVRAIIAMTDVKIGQTASDFWVVVGQGNVAAIYRVTSSSRGLSVRFATSLPSVPTQISRSPQGGIMMAFGRDNPPLHFGIRDGLTRACNNGTNAQTSLLP